MSATWKLSFNEMPKTLYRFSNYNEPVIVYRKNIDFGERERTYDYEKVTNHNNSCLTLYSYKYGGMIYCGFATLEDALTEKLQDAESRVKAANEKLIQAHEFIKNISELQHEADTREQRKKQELIDNYKRRNA